MYDGFDIRASFLFTFPSRTVWNLILFTARDKGAPGSINHLTPKDPYRGRTAPLTSKVAFYVFIQQI